MSIAKENPNFFVPAGGVLATDFFCHWEALHFKPTAVYREKWTLNIEHIHADMLENQPKKIKLESMTWIEQDEMKVARKNERSKDSLCNWFLCK